MVLQSESSIDKRRRISLASYHKNKLKGGQSRYYRRLAAGKCPKCSRPWIGETTHCPSCCEKQRAANQKYFDLIYEHYGKICVCCGETEMAFLTLDHINGDGAEQRKSATGKNGTSTNWRFWMVRRAQKTGAWPTDLQILCYNCNCGRQRNGGICPHQLKNTQDTSINA